MRPSPWPHQEARWWSDHATLIGRTSEIEDHGYGLVTYFKAPGGLTIQLYEPRYSKGESNA